MRQILAALEHGQARIEPTLKRQQTMVSRIRDTTKLISKLVEVLTQLSITTSPMSAILCLQANQTSTYITPTSSPIWEPIS